MLKPLAMPSCFELGWDDYSYNDHAAAMRKRSRMNRDTSLMLLSY
jgi:hypothetical protein